MSPTIKSFPKVPVKMSDEIRNVNAEQVLTADAEDENVQIFLGFVRYAENYLAARLSTVFLKSTAFAAFLFLFKKATAPKRQHFDTKAQRTQSFLQISGRGSVIKLFARERSERLRRPSVVWRTPNSFQQCLFNAKARLSLSAESRYNPNELLNGKVVNDMCHFQSIKSLPLTPNSPPRPEISLRLLVNCFLEKMVCSLLKIIVCVVMRYSSLSSQSEIQTQEMLTIMTLSDMHCILQYAIARYSQK